MSAKPKGPIKFKEAKKPRAKKAKGLSTIDNPIVKGQEKKMHVITNVVYGQVYFDIFTRLHLPSFLDPSNIPAVRDRIHYEIYTDDRTIGALNENENVKKLKDTCSVNISPWKWEDPNANLFAARYSTLVAMFHASVKLALKKDAYLSAIVADLVCAKDFLPKIQNRMDEGNHGAVFMLPLRSTYEAMAGALLEEMPKVGGALEAKRLCQLGQERLHPLWWACHWTNPLFTRLPFSLLWSNQFGALARSFSVTPIIFKPTIHMLNARHVIDVEVPSHCENPYWCENWTDAPIIGVEPIQCYYPTFKSTPSSVKEVGKWAQRGLHPTQFPYLEKNFYYPDKETARIEPEMQTQSDEVVKKVSEFGGFLA